MRISYFALCLLCSPIVMFAQDSSLADTLDIEQERKWEKIFESSVQDVDNSTRIDDKTYFKKTLSISTQHLLKVFA